MPPKPPNPPNSSNQPVTLSQERLANAQAMKVELLILNLADCLGIASFGIGSFTWGATIAAAKVLALNWPPEDPAGLIAAYDEMLDTIRQELARVFSERSDVQALEDSNDNESTH